MPPLFACFPVRLAFVALGIIWVVVVVFGLANPAPEVRPAPPPEPQSPGAVGWSPLWVFPLMLPALTAVMLVLAWYWPE